MPSKPTWTYSMGSIKFTALKQLLTTSTFCVCVCIRVPNFVIDDEQLLQNDELFIDSLVSSIPIQIQS